MFLIIGSCIAYFLPVLYIELITVIAVFFFKIQQSLRRSLTRLYFELKFRYANKNKHSKPGESKSSYGTLDNAIESSEMHRNEDKVPLTN